MNSHASYARTMASAKFRPEPASDLEVVNLIEARRHRNVEAERARAEREARFAAAKREADDAIARANARLRGLREGSSVSFIRIVRRICRVFGFSAKQLFSRRRTFRLVLARQAVCYWAYRLTMLSLARIGKHLGGRDHSTIHHATQTYPKKRALMGRTLREAS